LREEAEAASLEAGAGPEEAAEVVLPIFERLKIISINKKMLIN
jgi:hypothetical protein